MRELYRLVLVDTPLAPYFSECITSEVLIAFHLSFPLSLYHNTVTTDLLVWHNEELELSDKRCKLKKDI